MYFAGVIPLDYMRKNLFFLFLFWTVILAAQKKNHNQIDHFDFNNIQARIQINPAAGLVQGTVQYEFEVLDRKDTLFIDGRRMDFAEVQLNGSPANFISDDHGIYVISKFRPSEGNHIELKYSVTPESGMYFINWKYPQLDSSEKQVWTQGQGKYTSTWLPSFDDIREKVEFDLSFEFPSDYKLISNGTLVSNEKINDTTRLWQFDMEKPMSSYLVAVATGRFDAQRQTTTSGTEIFLYYQPEDSAQVEPTYRYTKEIFNFLEEEIGHPYSWKNYKQIPVKDFLHGGMENTGTTIFSNAFLTDSIGFKDRNFVNVNAHELAHQWFGNLVTAENGNHHWLHEGFATYYALLAEKKVFGSDYYYWKLFETAEKLKELSDAGKGEALLNPNASSLTFYQKGAWALHVLREKLGDKAFKQGVRNYLELYSYKNATTDNFLAEMEAASGQDLSEFKTDWLEQSAFKAAQALESLKKSEFITRYLEIAALREIGLNAKYELLKEQLLFPVNEYIGQEVVHQLAGLQSDLAINLYKKAFESNNIFVRQAIALSMNQIPESLKTEFETLLRDESYLTREAALYKLWEQFPEKRSVYLSQTRNMIGFNNKNIRMLWLTLNLVTPGYEVDSNEDYYQELAGYTEAWRPFQVRENAFGYLFQLGAFNDASLKSLILGTQHHTYSFRKYCRQLLAELLKNEQYRQQLIKLSAEMAEEDSVYLRKQITG